LPVDEELARDLDLAETPLDDRFDSSSRETQAARSSTRAS